MSIPVSQFIPPTTPLSPLVTINLFSTSKISEKEWRHRLRRYIYYKIIILYRSFVFMNSIPMCVCVSSPHHKAIPQTPEWCPTSQLNSDTIYLEITSDRTG